MPTGKGTIVLMGSGELTTTMVEVHKKLLAAFKKPARAVFLDTPAGFQLNADQISQKAVGYFNKHIQQPLQVASFKSREQASDYDAQQAFHILRESDYILIGPGSPTYAVRQWIASPIPGIFKEQIERGGCLVAASAAALTMGCFTLPVYEIYKVGEDLHWVGGMNILALFGFNLVVVPHWNNAEGGSHDTRFCFMGGPRFRALEKMLAEDVAVVGLDEHTACIMDLEKNRAEIVGIGRVVLRRRDGEVSFENGESVSLDVFRGGSDEQFKKRVAKKIESSQNNFEKEAGSFWSTLHELKDSFHRGLEKRDPKVSTNALLELDRTIWQAREGSESEEFVTQARDMLRELLVRLGIELAGPSNVTAAGFARLVQALVDMRWRFKEKKQWTDADALRDILKRLGVVLEDTAQGTRWSLER